LSEDEMSEASADHRPGVLGNAVLLAVLAGFACLAAGCPRQPACAGDCGSGGKDAGATDVGRADAAGGGDGGAPDGNGADASLGDDGGADGGGLLPPSGLSYSTNPAVYTVATPIADDL